MTIYQVLSWVSAAVAVSGIYLNGRKLWWSWFFNLANSAVLTVINIHFKLWGFIPLCLLTAVMYMRNAYKWHKDNKLQRRTT